MSSNHTVMGYYYWFRRSGLSMFRKLITGQDVSSGLTLHFLVGLSSGVLECMRHLHQWSYEPWSIGCKVLWCQQIPVGTRSSWLET